MIDSDILTLVNRARGGELLDAGALTRLFEIPAGSPESSIIIASGREITLSSAPAEIHGQVGINIAPCPRNCLFCAFAEDNKVFPESIDRSIEDIVADCVALEKEGANAIFLMATAQFPHERFAEIGVEVRRALAPESIMVANVGDFNAEQGRRFKDAGFAGIYHAIRMGEGRDTRIKPETRLRTIEAARKAGLIIGTCVEPIGSEHTTEELVEKTLITRNMDPVFSGAMRRIPIPGTALARHPIVTELRMAHIVAVVRLAMGAEVLGNCTHEPNALGAAAGANLFWAEVGSNPRDTEAVTEEGRGWTVTRIRELCAEVEMPVLDGPSRFYRV